VLKYSTLRKGKELDYAFSTKMKKRPNAKLDELIEEVLIELIGVRFICLLSIMVVITFVLYRYRVFHSPFSILNDLKLLNLDGVYFRLNAYFNTDAFFNINFDYFLSWGSVHIAAISATSTMHILNQKNHPKMVILLRKGSDTVGEFNF
jgi:hypothetical protein